jgi:lipocalin
VFRGITLRGQRGEISYGFRRAAALRSWVIMRDPESRQWTLAAGVDRADTFQLSRRPLQFTAPRYAKPAGVWCFDVQTLDVRGDTLTATLGPPAHS